MHRLIAYVGHDPSEDCSARRIDVRAARRLRARGLRWREVAEELTIETGRAVAYTADAVRAAVKRDV